MTDNSPFDEFFDFDEPNDGLDGFDDKAVDDGFGGFAEYGTAYSGGGTTAYSAAADEDSGYDDDPEEFFREDMFSIADIWKEYPKTVQWDTELMAIGDHTMRATIMQRQQTPDSRPTFTPSIFIDNPSARGNDSANWYDRGESKQFERAESMDDALYILDDELANMRKTFLGGRVRTDDSWDKQF